MIPDSNLLGITAMGIVVIKGLEGIVILLGWRQPSMLYC